MHQPYTPRKSLVTSLGPAEKQRLRTKVNISIQLLQRILQRRLRISHIRRIQLGRQEYLFPRNTRQLDPFPDLFLVRISSSGIDVPVPSFQSDLDRISDLFWGGLPGP